MNNKKYNTLSKLEELCIECAMCRLGMSTAEIKGDKYDPHVFSNMTNSKFVVVGQNPGTREVFQEEPFVGDSGRNFNREIEKHGLTRNSFYITNAVKCFTQKNRVPTSDEIKKCESILTIELNLVKPHFLISLGAVAFNLLCPNHKFSSCLGKLTESKYGYRVFAIYHPSPINLRNTDLKSKFDTQIALMCKLVNKLK